MARFIKNPHLVLHVPGAKPHEIKRGLAAARAVFEREAVTPDDASRACWLRNANDDGADVEMSEYEHSISHVWDDAEFEAVVACCGSAEATPRGAYLEWKFRHADDVMPRWLKKFRSEHHGQGFAS